MSKKRANGEGTFYHDTKRNNWQYKLTLGFYDDGYPIRKTFYGKTQQEARQKGQNALKELEGQRVSLSPDMKLCDWLVMYIENYKRNAVQDRWYGQLRTMISRVPQLLQNRKVSAVRPAELQKFINDLAQKYSKSYIQKMKILLKSAFSEAIENGLCFKNPAMKLTIPEKAEKPRASFTAHEVGIILDMAPQYYNQVIATGAVLLLLTGIRRGELLGLMWDDINGGVIHIRRGVFLEDNMPKVEEYRAKTKSSIRDVPLLPPVKMMLEKLPLRGKYIFGTSKGTLMETNNFNRDYSKFMDFIRVQHPNIQRLTPHCCRHTYATLALDSGANLRNVQLLLGHTDPKTTARYTHPDSAALQKVGAEYLDYLQDKRKDNQADNSRL